MIFWHTFINNLDYFKYFITSSGAVDPDKIDSSIQKQGYTKDDFLMMSFTGTEDFASSGFQSLIEYLKSSSSKNFDDNNLNFKIKQGYSHDHVAFMTYMYNGLLGFYNSNTLNKTEISNNTFNLQSTVGEVRRDSSFNGYGNLIFSVHRNIPDNTTLKDVGDYYVWYNNLNPSKTVEIVNYMKAQADSGNKIFYDIYTDEEKVRDPEKQNTGLFFFKGNPNEKFAVVSAGGRFSYVGAMHDSFPHCLELSKKGYNAFAIIYRPDANKAFEDLERAIDFIRQNKDELQVEANNYSLWGGSAGARMAAWVGNDYIPHPSAVIMEYTGLSEVTGYEPPTYNVVGTSDGIAAYQTMQNRINRIKANGTKYNYKILEDKQTKEKRFYTYFTKKDIDELRKDIFNIVEYHNEGGKGVSIVTVGK